MNTNFKRVSEKNLNECIKSLGGAAQMIAVLLHIYKHPDSYTHQVAYGAGAINVPDVAQRLRPICRQHGIRLKNYLPDDKLITRHGTRSLLHKWRLEEAEGGESSDQALTRN